MCNPGSWTKGNVMCVFAGVCKLYIERGYIANTTTVLEDFPAVPCSESCSEFLYHSNLSSVFFCFCCTEGEGESITHTACYAVTVCTSCFSRASVIKQDVNVG